jgi:hypothetical protein
MPPDTPPHAPAPRSDSRTLRLFDLAPHEAIVVTCECGWITTYGPGFLQRHHRLPSDTLIYDLQYRLRCRHCNRTNGFGIIVEDRRDLQDSTKPRITTIVVPIGK